MNNFILINFKTDDIDDVSGTKWVNRNHTGYFNREIEAGVKLKYSF